MKHKLELENICKGLKAVDMGLGVMWADRDFMAPEPGEAGIALDYDDAMYVVMEHLKSEWRLPSREEVLELLHETSQRPLTDGRDCVGWRFGVEDNGVALLRGEYLTGDAIGHGLVNTLAVDEHDCCPSVAGMEDRMKVRLVKDYPMPLSEKRSMQCLLESSLGEPLTTDESAIVEMLEDCCLPEAAARLGMSVADAREVYYDAMVKLSKYEYDQALLTKRIFKEQQDKD